jgi:hypothetical protein
LLPLPQVTASSRITAAQSMRLLVSERDIYDVCGELATSTASDIMFCFCSPSFFLLSSSRKLSAEVKNFILHDEAADAEPAPGSECK